MVWRPMARNCIMPYGDGVDFTVWLEAAVVNVTNYLSPEWHIVATPSIQVSVQYDDVMICIETLSALVAICEGNPPVTGEFPS